LLAVVAIALVLRSGGAQKVAVARFSDPSADASTLWMARGVSEALAIDLRRLRGWQLVDSDALDRAAKVKGLTAPVAERADQLEPARGEGATLLVRGSLLVEGQSRTAIYEVLDTGSGEVLAAGRVAGFDEKGFVGATDRLASAVRQG